MTKYGRKQSIIICAALAVAWCFSASVAFAAFQVNVSPAVIDGEGKDREILHYTVTIKNESKQIVSLYPWVRDVTPSGEAVTTDGTDVTTALSSWLEFSRSALAIAPGDSVDLPLLVQINLRAKPGNYHALLHFSNGGNRAEAELNSEETASVMLNIKVLDDINERLQLGTFTPDKNVFPTDHISFSYHLENNGNRGLVPTGKIRIYDRKGEEVADIDANQDGSKLEPDAKKMIAAAWSSDNQFGRYKAMLDLRYGNHGTLQDTVFFWVLPWKHLLSLFVSLALVCVVLGLLFHSYVSSGGKKFAYVTQRLRAWRGGDTADHMGEDAPEHVAPVVRRVASVLPSHEILSRKPTTLSHHEGKREHPHYDGGRVRLADHARSAVNPAHVVRLKK